MRNFAEAIPDTASSEDISTRLKQLDDSWVEFQTIEDSLLLIDGQVSDMEEYEQKFYETRSLLVQALNSRAPRPPSDTSFAEHVNSTMAGLLTQQKSFFHSLERTHSSVNSTRLPKLNIPTFSGEYKEWPAFKDLFEASVNANASLTGAQKFQHLKGLLEGNAASVIRHLTISDQNYNEAWNKLK